MSGSSVRKVLLTEGQHRGIAGIFAFHLIFRLCKKVIFAHLYTSSLSIIAERIPFDTGIKWIYSGYIFSFAKMRRPTIHLFLA